MIDAEGVSVGLKLCQTNVVESVPYIEYRTSAKIGKYGNFR
jgi:hypothetical protein